MARDEDDTFDPRTDLLDRYREMTNTQLEKITEIDRKAAATARIDGVISGLVLTAVSVGNGLGSVQSLPVLVATGVGAAALTTSLLFAIVTYLSSAFVYGPAPAFGTVLADAEVTSRDYKRTLPRGYTQPLEANETVVENNADRFRWSLTALLVAILYLFAASVAVVVPRAAYTTRWVVVAATSGLAVFTSWYILTRRYLTVAE